MSELVTKLICIKEAIMPGRGHFQPGDEIVDPELIEAIGVNHPFFQIADPQPPAEEPKQEGN